MAGTNPGTISLLGLGVDIKGIAEATNLSVNTDPPQKGPLYSAAGLLDGKACRQQAWGTRQHPSTLHLPSCSVLICSTGESEKPWEFKDTRTPAAPPQHPSPRSPPLMLGLHFRELSSCLCPSCCLRKSREEASVLPSSHYSVYWTGKQAEGT